MRRYLAFTLTLLLALSGRLLAAEGADPFQWLEAIDDPKALAWVREQNAATARRLDAAPEYAGLRADALSVLDSSSRIPEVSVHGKFLYNLWRDQDHPRGLYRRTTPSEFRKSSPQWETVLDFDALAKTEGKPWAFGGSIWRSTDPHRCLIGLSPGGGDARELREFDLDRLAFVEGGFFLPVAKTRAAWVDRDTLLVATDFGPDTLTKSGYPRVVKLWRRGTALTAAETLHVGEPGSVESRPRHFESKSGDISLVGENITYWTARWWQFVDAKLQPLEIPATATVVDAYGATLVLWLKNDWAFHGNSYPAGSVVVADPSALRGGAGTVELVVAPTESSVVTNVAATPDGLLVAVLDNVRGRLFRYTRSTTGWTRAAIALSDNGAITDTTTDDETGDAYVTFQTFTTPPTLYFVGANGTTTEPLKSQSPTFDGARFTVEQLWTTSEDGTRIPYFVVGAKGMKRDGSNPVWMFSYGGFEISLTPSYSGSYEELFGAYGKLWLERGGVFVLANIRGGGEFGPRWHQSALKENHVKAFEDFEAVARDLVARKITSVAHLAIEGRSNGGLLVASTMLRHPELYGAVVCGSPLLDMRRYSHLLAGASWIAEYGDPDIPSDWAYLSRYSPYQNVRAGLKLPPIMFYTSTRDDRVHPGHARKMAAKMMSLGYPVEYFETIEGGHHGSVTNAQLATRLARTFTFLWEHVGPPRD